MPDDRLLPLEIRKAYGNWYRAVRDAGEEFFTIAGIDGEDLGDAVEAVQTIVSFLPNPKQIPDA